MKRVSKLLFLITLLILSTSAGASAQSLKDRLKAKAKDKVSARAEHATEVALDSALNKGERVVKCVIGDKTCEKKAKAAGQTVVLTDKSGANLPAGQQPTPEAAAAVNAPVQAAPAAPPSTETSVKAASAPLWLNYDFVPGDRTIWFEDFSNDDVGDFPRRMDLKEGNFEVVKAEGKSWIHNAEGGGTVEITLPEVLPERFTIEVHMWQHHDGNPLKIRPDADGGDAYVWCTSTGGGVYGGFEKPQADSKIENPNFEPVECRFTIDARYIKAYVNDKRVANVPVANVKRSNKISIEIPSAYDEKTPFMMTDIRIAAGGKKLYDAIAKAGRVSTHGILFDSGKDEIRPESGPTLKEIGEMLKEHPELKLMIEGHTDNVGAAAANLDLSNRRAAAVKAVLVSQFGIDAARLQSKGFGATKPVAPNTSVEGKQSNRRVELVRLP